MADAYRHASDSQFMSKEINLLRQIDRFGVEAILGRKQLYARELRLMTIAENIVLGYEAREKSDNWAAWAHDNERLSELLIEAQKLAEA